VTRHKNAIVRFHDRAELTFSADTSRSSSASRTSASTIMRTNY
jgi:hypothetical protein